MKRFIMALAATALAPIGQFATAQEVPAAIFTDPVRDAKHPARMEVLHIPSGGVAINGLAYVAAGAGPHPVVLLCHGLPGNEKSLDLAQAMRRAGWTVITFNYRGSWGSPGSYRFAHDLEDADAVLAWLRTPANATSLGIDPKRIVMMGHSLGGWVTALTAAHDPALIGAALISPGNIGLLGKMPRETAAGFFTANGHGSAGRYERCDHGGRGDRPRRRVRFREGGAASGRHQVVRADLRRWAGA
jgi:pimeloyl-ACP methyl ester carboxylesterase